MADLSIQNAFLDGIEEIFSTMFTNRLYLSLLDEEGTTVNVYGESSDEKMYLSPIQLIGRIQTTFTQGEDPVEAVNIDAVITIPTKQLITHQIPHQTESDLETLKKAKFAYDGFEYLVDKVVPKTLVTDKWQMYDFMCHKDKNSSLDDYVTPPITPNPVVKILPDGIAVVIDSATGSEILPKVDNDLLVWAGVKPIVSDDGIVKFVGGE